MPAGPRVLRGDPSVPGPPSRGPIPDETPSMRTPPSLAAVLLVCASLAAQQGPGDYPRLVIEDAMGTQVPPPSGPFDNSGVFTGVQSVPFDVRVDYVPFSGPPTNVAWALILSGSSTPLPTDLIPPPLLAAPPFVFILPPIPTLDANGEGSLPLSVPSGVYFAETFLQALVYDATNTPKLQVSNGVRIDVVPPDFNVSTGWIRNLTGTQLTAEVGEIDIGADELNTLKPFGTEPPPLAEPIPLGGDPAGGAQTGIFRFEGIVLNEPRGGPVNPLDFGTTVLVTPLEPDDDVALVADASMLPPAGRVLIAHGSGTIGVNPFGNRETAEDLPPRLEVARYDSIDHASDPPRLVGLERGLLGTTGADALDHGFSGSLVMVPYSHASTMGARRRLVAGQAHGNIDTSRLTIPPFTFVPEEEASEVTMELDLIRYSDTISLDTQNVDFKRTGYMVFDHATQRFRLIQGTTRTPMQGTWDPMVHLSPDNRFFIATLRANPTAGVFGWDNRPDELWAIRLDGEAWPATGTETWRLTWVQGASPGQNDTSAPKRFVHVPFTRILGADPDNYVLYAGIGYKFKQSNLGDNFVFALGAEGEWVREELIVTDIVEVPLTPPGSDKPLPELPVEVITAQFGETGFGFPVERFDPHVLVDDDDSMMLLTGGGNNGDLLFTIRAEDTFVIRNVSVTPGGQVQKLIANLTGHDDIIAGPLGEELLTVDNRPFFTPGYPGHGAKAAFNPSSTRAAWLAKADTDDADWLQVARTNGTDFGDVENVFEDENGNFQESGALEDNRIITDLHFVDDDNLIFFMGRAPYDVTSVESLDLYHYDIVNDVMVNLTNTGANSSPSVEFEFGNLRPRGSFTSPNGQFRYFIRSGTAGPGEQLSNVVAVDRGSLDVFSITGQEFGFVGSLPSAVRGATESPASLGMITGSPPAQGGMVYFAAHEAGTTGDEVFAFDADFPFVALQVTSNGQPGVHVSNIVPNPFSGKVAFARTAGADPLADDQHPFVVDLDAFLFERDLVPEIQIGGMPVGRVMDGSFHFVPPVGNAADALVFTFGGTALDNGIANFAPPAYYPLANVSNELNEPVPVIIALADTALLGLNFRFYLLGAGASTPAP